MRGQPAQLPQHIEMEMPMSMFDAPPLRDSRGILWTRGKRQRPSEGELADRLAERHCRQIRYATWKRKWIAWNDESQEWFLDKQNLALHLGGCLRNRGLASAFRTNRILLAHEQALSSLEDR
jgi:hypothetical protein